MMVFDPKKVRLAAIISNAILTKTALVIGGYYLGHWLDKKWGTDPYFGLLGLISGISVGLAYVIYVARKYRPGSSD